MTQEAADLHRQFAAGDPSILNAHLTSSLNNFATHLSHLGHHEHALEVNREAVDILQQAVLASSMQVSHHHSTASLPVYPI